LRKSFQNGEVEADEYHEFIRVRGEKDFEFFCDTFFPHYAQYDFNQFHHDCFEDYKEHRTAVRSVDCAPRGYAKSAVKALFKPLHDLAYGLEKYIVFISATKPQALQKLKDIRREIFNNDFFSDVYGIHFSSKSVGAEAFEAKTDFGPVYLQAVGAGTEIRGIRFGEHRPTKIILDDVEDSEEVHNEDIRNKNYDWLQEVVANLGSNDTNIEIVGTILHRDSLLMRLSKNPAYKFRTYRAVISWSERQDLWEKWKEIYTNIEDANREKKADKFFKENETAMLKGTQVLWPEKEPYYLLMKQMEERGRRAFMKEKQNMPLPSDEALFDNIHWYYEDPKRGGVVIEKTGVFVPYRELFSYGGLDPATGKTKSKGKAKLDFSCMLGGYKDLKGRLFCHRDYTKKVKPTIYIRQIFEMSEELKFEKFVIEENLYRGLLTENITRERKLLEEERKKAGVKDWQIKVPFYEVENREKKEERIFTLEPKVNNGWILFNRSLSMDFMNQIEGFPHEDHDDAPDVLEMLWGLINNRYKPSPIPLDVMGSR
jgi:predicted phage terminase large subunit-like protein